MKRQRFYCFIYFAQNTDIHLSGKSVKLHDWPLTGSQLLAHSSERVNPDSEGDASKVEIQKMEAQYWYSLLQIPKEIYFPNRRDWWHENSTVVQDLTISVDITRVKPKLHRRRRRRMYELFLEPLQKPKVTSTNDLLKFGKSCEELSWNHRTSFFPSIRDDKLQNELYVE